MRNATIYTRASRAEVRRMVALLPTIIAGKTADPGGIAHGFAMRLSMAFFSKVKTAFIDKSRGGTDDAGDKWPPLTKAYLAYGRRFGRGERAALKRGAGLGAGNRFAPGGNKGLLTAAQLKRWNQLYAQNLAWLAARDGIDAAKGHAAAIAWSALKKEGAKTKLEVFGNRQVEILRDTGVLFNSLSPGALTTSGADASYAPPAGQVVEHRPGEVLLGTNVEYAAYHHEAKSLKRRRRLWPEPNRIPESWWRSIINQANGGLVDAITLLVRGRAA